jgi:hypothetical protein
MMGVIEIARMLPDPAIREKVLGSTRDFLLRSFLTSLMMGKRRATRKTGNRRKGFGGQLFCEKVLRWTQLPSEASHQSCPAVSVKTSAQKCVIQRVKKNSRCRARHVRRQELLCTLGHVLANVIDRHQHHDGPTRRIH